MKRKFIKQLDKKTYEILLLNEYTEDIISNIYWTSSERDIWDISVISNFIQIFYRTLKIMIHNDKK